MTRTQFLTAFCTGTVCLFSSACTNNPTNSEPEPIASFSYNGAMVSPATIRFTNHSENADVFEWRFGDGSTATTESPTHTYAVSGFYRVELTASNNHTREWSRTSQTLEILPSKAFLDSVIVDDIPFVDDFGASWDIGSGPDLFWTLERSNGAVLVTGSIIYDLTPHRLPVYWTLGESVRIPTTEELTIWLTDYDETSADDDIIAGAFDLRDYDNYPDEIYWDSPEELFAMTVYLHWE